MKGNKYGKLSVVSDVYYKFNGKRNIRFVDVVCDCGTEKSVYVESLKSGKSQSCGCSKKGINSTHGQSKTPLYGVWAEMKKRCDNPNHVKYDDYGGRGIGYDDSWKYYENFESDMSDGYTNDLEIDRIDTNQGYSAENCRWVNRGVNCHNRRKRKGSELDVIGVCMHGNGYRATLVFEGEKVLSKTFRSLTAAALAYDNASEEYYNDRPNKTTRNIYEQT